MSYALLAEFYKYLSRFRAAFGAAAHIGQDLRIQINDHFRWVIHSEKLLSVLLFLLNFYIKQRYPLTTFHNDYNPIF